MLLCRLKMSSCKERKRTNVCHVNQTANSNFTDCCMGVVYKIHFSCRRFIVGQTAQHIFTSTVVVLGLFSEGVDWGKCKQTNVTETAQTLSSFTICSASSSSTCRTYLVAHMQRNITLLADEARRTSSGISTSVGLREGDMRDMVDMVLVEHLSLAAMRAIR